MQLMALMEIHDRQRMKSVISYPTWLFLKHLKLAGLVEIGIMRAYLLAQLGMQTEIEGLLIIFSV